MLPHNRSVKETIERAIGCKVVNYRFDMGAKTGDTSFHFSIPIVINVPGSVMKGDPNEFLEALFDEAVRIRKSIGEGT